ncbi:MAG: hypothetical protein HKO66_03240 [Saprospiraceae bacterium]|nr:hypothetical protein [Saprospiraceae bacterium]
MTNSNIDDYISKHQWSKPLQKLRTALLKTELVETVKWGMPVYTINNKNVVGLAGFKHHFGLWFYQGVFLKDEHHILRNAQEGKTKGMRHIKYNDEKEIDMKIIKSYVNEAIANAKLGKEIKPEKSKIKCPPIFEDFLNDNKKLKKKFDDYTPGRKKEFYEYIGSAKRESTQLKRLDECRSLIEKGSSPMDKYRK